MSECKSKLGHEKAVWATDRARYELHRLGYFVGLPGHICANGADLTVSRNGKSLTVEVKLAMWNKRAWRVNRVTRKKDDIIAIVFPSGAVHFQDMESHLAACAKNGDRYLTALGRFFE